MSGKEEHEVVMYPGRRGSGYNASCSCGWRAYNSTPDLIGRHKQARAEEASRNRIEITDDEVPF